MMKLKALMCPTLESSLDDCPSNYTAILLTSEIVQIQIETEKLSFILASISEDVD